jgi:hypothetical protein
MVNVLEGSETPEVLYAPLYFMQTHFLVSLEWILSFLSLMLYILEFRTDYCCWRTTGIQGFIISYTTQNIIVKEWVEMFHSLMTPSSPHKSDSKT